MAAVTTAGGEVSPDTPTCFAHDSPLLASLSFPLPYLSIDQKQNRKNKPQKNAIDFLIPPFVDNMPDVPASLLSTQDLYIF